MIFHAFYNPEHIGDVLMIRLGTGVTSTYEKKDDIVILKDSKDSIIGYNILKATQYFSNLNTGLVKITKAIITECNALFSNYQLPEVTADLEEKFIVGKVIKMEDHPDSDHLHVFQVDLGKSTTQIVCGASNVAAGQLVVVATIGAVMPSGLIIRPSKLRKVDSNGMLCSARELLLNEGFNTQGIIVLEDSKYEVGKPFFNEGGKTNV